MEHPKDHAEMERKQLLRDKYGRREPVILDLRSADEILRYGDDGLPPS